MRLVLLTLIALGIALTGAVASAFANADASLFKEAREDLDQLKKLLGDKKATTDELVSYIDVAIERHQKAEGPAKDVERFRGDVEKILFKALTKTRVKRLTSVTRSGERVNLLEDVNIAAANAIAKLGPSLDADAQKSFAKKLERFVESLEKERRYMPSDEKIDATFVALARVGSNDTLAWLLDEYHHTKSVEAQFLIGAHKAMILFGTETVPGKLRYAVVKEFVDQYAGVEAQAEKSSNAPDVVAKKRFWDRVRTYTIAVVQHFAGFPEHEGVALAKMDEFRDWFRGHKNVRRAPWVDAD